jgi:hypothetical protein
MLLRRGIRAWKESTRMKLKHINLTVTDVLETRKFLEKYFGMRGGGGNRNNRLPDR